jgi:sphingomyelin phosphodiesterase acid-like 3
MTRFRIAGRWVAKVSAKVAQSSLGALPQLHRPLDCQKGRNTVKRIAIRISILIALILSWSPAAQVNAAPSPAAPTGHALLLCDIHFDPLADPAIVKQLIAAPASQWEAIFATSAQGGYAHSPNDANYPLLKSTLSAAAAQNPFDFVIASGDYLRHDFQSAFVKAGGSPSDFPAFASKAAVFVVNTIQATLGVPVYLALGNGDSPCGDYGLVPGSAFLAALADSLDVLAHNAEAAADFRTAGFYELPHPTLPKEEILVLTSVLWSPRYSNCGSDGSDPGAAEMQWLGWKLYDAKTLGNRVILVMHIPPGIDAYASSRSGDSKFVTQFWRDRYFTQFLELMQSYGDIVEIAFAGHTHMDDFRVLRTSGSTPPIGFRTTPAISPIFGNNPAFSVLNYSVSTGAVSDIATYYLDLMKGGDNPQWALEYCFSTAYGYDTFTAGNLETLAAAIHNNPNVRQIFAGYYAASAPSPITSNNWPFYICTETQFTTTDYSHCVWQVQISPSHAAGVRGDQ